MKSRYDFMSEGSVYDEISGSLYPDPLSLNYQDLKLTSTPIKDNLSADKITLFWYEAEKIYGGAYYDDIVLTLNGVSHKNLLKPNDYVYFPTEDDIRESFSKD